MGMSRMHLCLALLCVSIAAAPGCTGLPTRSRSAIDAVINIARTTLVHIKRLNLTVNQPIITPNMEGLSSTSHYLGLLDSELRGHKLELLSQIQADVSSLGGRVRSLPWMAGCAVPNATAAPSNDGSYPDSQLQQTLMKVRDYLGKFEHSQDTLMVC